MRINCFCLVTWKPTLIHKHELKYHILQTNDTSLLSTPIPLKDGASQKKDIAEEDGNSRGPSKTPLKGVKTLEPRTPTPFKNALAEFGKKRSEV